MIIFIIFLISLKHLFLLPVVSIPFCEDHSLGSSFSDIFDLEPIFETITPTLNSPSSSTQKSKAPLTASDNLNDFKHELTYSLDDIKPIDMLELRKLFNVPSTQEEIYQAEQEMGLKSNPIIESNISPTENYLLADGTETSHERLNQHQSIEPLVLSNPNVGEATGSGTKPKALSLTFSALKKKRKATVEFQENRKNKKQIQVIQDPKYHYYVKENTFNAVLQWQCRLLLAKRYKISENIEDFFEGLKESSRSRFKYAVGPSSVIHNLQTIAFKRLQTHFVPGVLGAFKIVFQRHVEAEWMHSLILDLWEYLQRYLNTEFSFSPKADITKLSERQKRQSHSHIKPGNLLEYTLHLSQGVPPSSKIIYQKLQEWADTTSYKCLVSGIMKDYWSFVEQSDVCYKQKGDEKTVYRKKDKKSKNLEYEQENMVTNHDKRRKDSGSGTSRTDFIYGLEYLGQQLHYDIESMSQPGIDGESHSKINLKRSDIGNTDMVHKKWKLIQLGMSYIKVDGNS
ncbi:uncharacterized protein MELLADRAFT_114073 [Melampsora larici-populina 98AG31]|uniref:Secreted protein n=1 Tax=Melampsora larici-populina (strain 98AG31 / pathotype 3-4-7) TaxID=747676 RepID=F4SC29_MELLP|nr:uncharacterized protein MELLADRAFT_114073 [Melampsora larici-populina 98AG31]EGF97808.1 hypothetical protein MELLADRAFT_114073 [Melampsora larici-populina 98AG31]